MFDDIYKLLRGKSIQTTLKKFVFLFFPPIQKNEIISLLIILDLLFLSLLFSLLFKLLLLGPLVLGQQQVAEECNEQATEEDEKACRSLEYKSLFARGENLK